MKYEIKNKSDFATGSFLSLSIPDDEVDYYALNTICADCPDFILPFSYKCVDGEIELTYKIGTLSKLIYFSGDVSAREYIEFWKSFFEPLAECRDWFMKSHSFVFDVDYLYYDKHSRKVKYLYIPSSCKCSDSNSFNALASELSEIITVSDTNLENKLFRAIMNNFTPADTIKMLKDYLKESSCLQSDVTEETMSPSVQPTALVDSVKSTPVIRHSSKSRAIGKLDSTEITQNIPIVHNEFGLKYVGNADFPEFIQVEIEQGGVFTIGRFNSSIGKKQSDFEFDKKTKAVSRRHAVIERASDVYKIVDLSSSAGTFLNSQRLPPNTPCELEVGARVSFGNLGADYVWEVS